MFHAQNSLHVGQPILLGNKPAVIVLIAQGRAMLSNGQWIELRKLQEAA